MNASTASDTPALAVPFDIGSVEADPPQTDRLILRPIRADDSDDIWEYQRLPEVLRYIPWPRRTREEAHDHTLRRAERRRLAEDGDATHFALVLRGEPSVGGGAEPAAPGRDRVIGDVMMRVTSVEWAQIELGWALHPDFQGRGLAYEGTARVLRFTFETLRAHRVHASLDVRNTASAALCERLGMRHEGTLLEDEYDDGWQDSAMYAILRREWEGRG
ncbi:GNAT family N-acetyltransferase [Agromyces endophyticus]|uniref:GNAT family N-acetyltransferase n=1 Tax=Agromyces sp. H17E-10 TaxID=2932244 RepID=UPI001FD5269C|nr:GNAT family N-acetyltransferase [Agromyces sp. H17E-10]UOQ90863.1 GNAT family N-acetyltransferase [Agromyces sp. H17E-10]